jgi:CRP-like cAMP-binding protein
MSLERDIALLRGIPFLAELSDEQIKLLAFAAELRDFSAGMRLFSEGAAADSAFVVVAGSVALVRETPSGDETIVVVEPGCLIGETALLVETRRPATAKALEPTTVLQIRRSQFHRMMAEYPDIAVRLQRTIAERLQTTTSRLNNLLEELEAQPEPAGRARAQNEDGVKAPLEADASGKG